MQPRMEIERREFDTEVRYSFVGPFRLVHLDRPDEAEIARRNSSVGDGSFFDDDCPICRAQRKRGGDIVFESDLDWLENGEPVYEPGPDPDESEGPEPASVCWRRTYVDLDGLAGQPGRTAVHSIATGVTFCLLELIDDVALLGQSARWGESLRHYASCFARFSPALCGSDRLTCAEARNLGALAFQVRSYLGWFRESVPQLDSKCLDLDRIGAALLEALRLFDEDEAP